LAGQPSRCKPRRRCSPRGQRRAPHRTALRDIEEYRMAKNIGILTAGGDSPGLNAAIRAVGKSAERSFGMNVIGFRDGFRGLMEHRTVRLNGSALSGILTIGGTILGTSRDKPHKMPMGGDSLDMTDVIVNNYHKH